MRAIQVQAPGTDYRLVVDTVPQPEPGPGQVLVSVAAAGLNNADLLQARGKYPPPPGASPLLGMEVSGTIAKLGNGVSGWSIGDRVCALLAGGGYVEQAIADEGLLLPVPETVDLVEAAGLPEALFTAWTNVMDTGRLQPGESLLIHGGTSGIGSIAIQMFAARGNRIFTTVGSAKKCEVARALGAGRAVNYHEEDFVAVVKATPGKGVDVILDMVGGLYVQRNMSAASVWGRIVNIAYQDGAKVSLDLGPLLMKRLTLAATTLRARSSAEKGAIRDALLDRIWPMVADGRIRPVVDR